MYIYAFSPLHTNGTAMNTRGYAALSAGTNLLPFEFDRRDIGVNDVELDIKFAGICHSDIHQVREEWGPATNRWS